MDIEAHAVRRRPVSAHPIPSHLSSQVRRRDVYMEEVFEEMTDGVRSRRANQCTQASRTLLTPIAPRLHDIWQINAMTDGQLHALLHRMTASEEALDGVQVSRSLTPISPLTRA
jgi:hypothetical protein